MVLPSFSDKVTCLVHFTISWNKFQQENPAFGRWKDLQLAFWLQNSYNPGTRENKFHEVISIRKANILIPVFLAVALFLLPVRARAAADNPSAGVVATSSGRLNVRTEPGTGAAVAASLSKGSYVTLLSRSGDWWYVRYAQAGYGYCHSRYITQMSGSAATVTTRSGALNVRSGPGTGYARTGSLAKGERVVVLSTSGGWSRILFQGGRTGYVSAQYLSSGYAAAGVTVPDFKQTDSRWATVTIGQSGKTMAQIGCATTAIAMMESARTGTDIYPDAMARQLTYTPSGSVYWPSHYRVVTGEGGYIAGIYDLLRQGKPVLLGCRDSYGKQHWVVVTGFSGGDALRPDSFTIRDPGSQSRRNLQQFLDKYPQFYKYFYWQ